MLLPYFTVSAGVTAALAANYSRTDNVVGSAFNDFFLYDNIADPTHGRVNFVDGPTAQKLNLTYFTSDSFILRADSQTVLTKSGPGRNSVRLLSKRQFANGVTVADIRHMPQGCGTWPAFWSIAYDFSEGEIDILEGVNDQGPNYATLHTTSGCTMPQTRDQTGFTSATDCDVNVGNGGCGVGFTDNRSYGPAFNQAGGGWYAMERTDMFIKIWFWSRNATDVPADVKRSSDTVVPDNWGTPAASFPNTSCDIGRHFGPENIIINLSFCGSWGGVQSVYSSAGCPGTCVDFVNNNPSAFVDAYFDFARLSLYQ